MVWDGLGEPSASGHVTSLRSRSVGPVPQDHVAAARAVYDVSAERYVQLVCTEIRPATDGPVDRSMLTALVDIAAAGDGTRVADVGWGPGRVVGFVAHTTST